MPEGAMVCANCGTAATPGNGTGPSGPASGGPTPAAGAYTTSGASSGAIPDAQTLANRLIARVKAILVTPRTEWPVIADETTTAQDIYLRYVAPLVAVDVIATFLGQVLVGVPVPLLGTIRFGFGVALGAAILHFVLTFVVVFVVAMIVDALAPTFGGQKDPLRALKVTAYSFTPAWVAAILLILPSLGFVAAVLGLYGLYLLYLGLPVLMRAPTDKSLGYTVVIVLCAILLSVIIGAVTAAITGGLAPHP
ncbi:MAG TPA: Yip1 family protein [Casimicrobiaceae bacterium]|nr:Yip1 family protein [Casimicrobiaceae bacterium]